MTTKSRQPIFWLIGATLLAQPFWSSSSARADQVADANNAFALDLYAQLAKQPGNLFLSPLSIYASLSMAQVGARGETARQMGQVLHFSGDGQIPAGFDALRVPRIDGRRIG